MNLLSVKLKREGDDQKEGKERRLRRWVCARRGRNRRRKMREREDRLIFSKSERSRG